MHFPVRVLRAQLITGDYLTPLSEDVLLERHIRRALIIAGMAVYLMVALNF